MKIHCLVLLALVSLSAVLSSAKVRKLGGISVAEPNSSRVQQAANFAVGVISDYYAGDYKLGLLQVINATQRVVAGYWYEINLVVARTDCTKLSPKKSCTIPEDAKSKDHPDYNECKVKVWELRDHQAWRTPKYSIKCSKPNKNVKE